MQPIQIVGLYTTYTIVYQVDAMYTIGYKVRDSVKGCSMAKTTTMRIDTKVQTALAIIAGEVQVEKAVHNLSANDALWEFIGKHRPDIVERVTALMKLQQQKTDNQ